MSYFLPTHVEKASLRLLEGLATPTSLKVAILLRNQEWDQIASLQVIPSHYLTAESYWQDASAVSLLRKCKDLPTTFDKKQVAVRTFFDCEKECYRTNMRLAPYLRPGLYQDENTGVTAFFRRARKIASAILGPIPDLDEIDGRFGPGTTYGDRGQFITVPDKISSRPTLTPKATCVLPTWAHTLWAKAHIASGQELLLAEGNRFTTVPKDAEKDRGIAAEPSLNVFYQLQIGTYIRKRLRGAGINLADGQDIHRRVACEASIRGHLASVDLSNASDTIGKNLVRVLLPPPWFDLLDRLRSHRSEIDGKWYYLEKFSSMGNGFTFELETLVFLCLLKAMDPEVLVPGDNLFVYGDDILVPCAYQERIKALFSFCGLKLNARKSFFSGPFRESCGGDFFNGVAVRPFFLKELPLEPQQYVAFANGLRRSALCGAEYRWLLLRRAWFSVLDAIPSHIRNCRGPEALGDLLIHDECENWNFKLRRSQRWFNVYRPAKYRKVSWNVFRPDVAFAAAVYGVPWNEGWIIPRDSVAGHKIGRVAYS